MKWLSDEGAPKKHLKVLEDERIEKCLSIISIWEIAMLVSKKRLTLNQEIITWISLSLERSGVTLLALNPKTVVLSCNLSGFNNADPADRIIVATALSEKIPLLTLDKKIISYLK